MWNDYWRDVGFGIHADKKEIKQFLKVLLKLYVPELKDKPVQLFFSNNDYTENTDRFKFEYTYYRGPAIDERLITLTPK